MKNYYYGKQKITKADIVSVLKVLKSNTISQGPELLNLEKKISKYCGSKYCVAVSSGSAALHLAVLSLNLKKPFYGLTSPITFVATVNCLLHSGGKFDLIDINLNDYNIDHLKLDNYLKRKKKLKQKLPKILLPVHFGGVPTKMDKIYKTCKKYNIKIIEDASQSLGAKYKGQNVGSSKYSDLTVFSLHPVKSITSGEGGLILTNSKKIYQNLLQLRINGIFKNSKKSWVHDMKGTGYNYKISEINCALASSQLKKLDVFIYRRTHIAEFYMKHLDNKIFDFQNVDKFSKSAWHLFIIFFKKKISQRKKSLFYEKLVKKKINLDIKYRPIQSFTYFKKNFRINKCPNSEVYFNQSFCLPIYVDLKDSDLKKICKNINKTAKEMKL